VLLLLAGAAARGWRRGLGTAAVFAAIVVAVVGFVGALGSLLIAQIGDLVEAIPGYAQQVSTFLNERLGTSLSGGELAEQLRDNEGVKDFVNGLAAGPSACPPPWSAWSSRASPSGCSPSTWSPTGRGCAGRSARCCPRRWRRPGRHGAAAGGRWRARCPATAPPPPARW
jgi:hypothetical protein